MMRKTLILCVLCLPTVALAQKENAEIRNGNELWTAGRYKDAEIHYRNALQINGESPAAMSNLASALFRQQQYADAMEAWGRLAQNKELKKTQISEASYNVGNVQLKERKLDEAIASYKQALRLNPSDKQAKYNLAYAQKLKQEQNGGGKNDKQDKQQQQQDQKQQQQQQDNKQNQDQQQQAPKPESRAEAERIADAIQQAEDRTKERVDKQKAQAQPVGGSKQW